MKFVSGIPSAVKPTVAQGILCLSCGNPVLFCVDNSFVYGKTYGNGMIYICSRYPNCDSYVGAHKNGRPLGVPANKEVRKSRMEAHAAFDVLWLRESPIRRFLDRTSAYLYLSYYMGRAKEITHIGMFTSKDCDVVISFSPKVVDTYPHGSRLSESTFKSSWIKLRFYEGND